MIHGATGADASLMCVCMTRDPAAGMSALDIEVLQLHHVPLRYCRAASLGDIDCAMRIWCGAVVRASACSCAQQRRFSCDIVPHHEAYVTEDVQSWAASDCTGQTGLLPTQRSIHVICDERFASRVGNTTLRGVQAGIGTCKMLLIKSCPPSSERVMQPSHSLI